MCNLELAPKKKKSWIRNKRKKSVDVPSCKKECKGDMISELKCIYSVKNQFYIHSNKNVYRVLSLYSILSFLNCELSNVYYNSLLLSHCCVMFSTTLYKLCLPGTLVPIVSLKTGKFGCFCVFFCLLLKPDWLQF